jgi:hypothetical protein
LYAKQQFVWNGIISIQTLALKQQTQTNAMCTHLFALIRCTHPTPLIVPEWRGYAIKFAANAECFFAEIKQRTRVDKAPGNELHGPDLKPSGILDAAFRKPTIEKLNVKNSKHDRSIIRHCVAKLI